MDNKIASNCKASVQLIIFYSIHTPRLSILRDVDGVKKDHLRKRSEKRHSN